MKIPTKNASIFYSCISFLFRLTLSREQHLEEFAAKHLVVDRRGSPRALGLLPPSPAVRPVIAEVTLWKSIGDALAPTDPFLLSTDIFFSVILIGSAGG